MSAEQYDCLSNNSTNRSSCAVPVIRAQHGRPALRHVTDAIIDIFIITFFPWRSQKGYITPQLAAAAMKSNVFFLERFVLELLVLVGAVLVYYAQN